VLIRWSLRENNMEPDDVRQMLELAESELRTLEAEVAVPAEGAPAVTGFNAVVLETLQDVRAGRRLRWDELVECRPQRVFEALLALHTALHEADETPENRKVLLSVWGELRRLNPRLLSRHHLLWETLLQTETCRPSASLVSMAMAVLLENHTVVPAEAARRGRERGDDVGQVVWLLSAEPDVPPFVLQLLSRPRGPYRHLFACVRVAVARHAIDLMPKIRSDIAAKQDHVWIVLQLLKDNCFEDESVFSEEEWEFLLNRTSFLQILARLFHRERRPNRIVAAFLLNARRELQVAQNMTCFGPRWVTREEADELVVMYDGLTPQRDPAHLQFLAVLLSRPWASRSLRFAVLRKLLSETPRLHHDLVCAGADWAVFDDAELRQLVSCCDDLLGHDAVAQELCRRRLEPRELQGEREFRLCRLGKRWRCAATLCTMWACLVRCSRGLRSAPTGTSCLKSWAGGPDERIRFCRARCRQLLS
jgi:hypothetical protein